MRVRGFDGRRVALAAGLFLSAFALTASPAQADTLFFTNGRTMSVKSSRIDGSVGTVTLRGGGQATFDASMISRVAQSEVPDPEEPATESEDASVAPPQ